MTPPFELEYRHVFVLPTKFGWAFGFMLVVMMLELLLVDVVGVVVVLDVLVVGIVVVVVVGGAW